MTVSNSYPQPRTKKNLRRFTPAARLKGTRVEQLSQLFHEPFCQCELSSQGRRQRQGKAFEAMKSG